MKGNSTNERGIVTVRYGVFAHELQVAGYTVAETRDALTVPMNLQPDTTTLLDGEPAEDSTVLEARQELRFVRPACCKH